MTDRGRAVLALGLFVYLAAWIFGSRALYPVATGLLFAVAVAVAWVRFSNRPPQVRRHGAARDVVEGDDVRIDLELTATGAVAPPTLVAHERPGRLPERRIDLHRVGRRRFAGGYELRAVPRGRYAFETVRLTIEDPFGLARASLEQGEPQALVVYPRLVALDRLFSEGGAHAELEDAPRDEVAILLDGDARSGAGEGFEVAVRAAGSILQAHLRRGRRCALVVNSNAREAQPVTSEGQWRRAREVLAAAEPNARTPAFALLQGDGGVAARSLELVVVTSCIDVALVDRLVQRALSRRGASLVYVDTAGRPEPQLLRLQAAGIPVAVVRPGEDLAGALSGGEARVA